MSSHPKYPDVAVRLTGHDGNAFSVIAAVSKALRKHGVPEDEVQEFKDEAMSGNYDHLLRTAMAWVDVS